MNLIPGLIHAIRTRQKVIEVRTRKRDVEEGDFIMFRESKNSRTPPVYVRIRQVVIYRTFVTALLAYGVRKVVPRAKDVTAGLEV